jgi:hypothetical protein
MITFKRTNIRKISVKNFLWFQLNYSATISKLKLIDNSDYSWWLLYLISPEFWDENWSTTNDILSRTRLILFLSMVYCILVQFGFSFYLRHIVHLWHHQDGEISISWEVIPRYMNCTQIPQILRRCLRWSSY